MKKRRNSINPEIIDATAEELTPWIGRNVSKISGKKFKSGRHINRVKAIVPHPNQDKLLAFTFFEDDSVVECRRCQLDPLSSWQRAIGELFGSVKLERKLDK